MTFDKLGICRYLNNDDFFETTESIGDVLKYSSFERTLLNDNDESLLIRTKTG